MAVTRARIVRRCAPLHGGFGVEYATKLFGADVLAQLPRYQRGAHKGQAKAFLVWDKAEAGGWDRRYGVCKPGLVFAWITDTYNGEQPLYAEWLGATQALKAHRDVFRNPGAFTYDKIREINARDR